MTRVVVLLIVFVAALSANPVAVKIFSEIQTAPDSLERIELHMYEGPFYGLDLYGVEIVTRAGTAVIDSSFVIYPDGDYVVIDSTNTSGVFSLGDDSDYVSLVTHSSTFFRFRYPANPFRSDSSSWAPPPGTSASILQWKESGSDDWIYTWYIDATPTFGAPNDDTLGGITGHVYGDHGLPVDGAIVGMTAAQGTAEMPSGEAWGWPHGYFAQRPTGPGRFVVTANYSGYLPYTYPETIELASNEERDLDIQLQRQIGAVDERPGSAAVVDLHQRGRTLVLDADRSGEALVTVYDDLGRVRVSDKIVLVEGTNELALPSLQSGVYFADCQLGQNTLKTKFVLY